MNKLPKFLIGCSIFALMPAVAGAAGTYYTGNYQSPQQQRYSNQSYAAQRGGTYTQNGVTYNRVPQGGYSNASYASTRPGVAPRANSASQQKAQNTTARNSSKVGNGFTVGGGLSHEAAMWKFEMKDSGSILRYDDVSWNVLDLHGAYAFDVGSMTLKVDAGFKYGMQAGESSMTDDDITNGGYFVTQWVETDSAGNITKVIGDQMGHALSIGTSDGGKMYGFNVGFGLVDAFSLGKVKFTPSVGYRYLKYELETKKNYGLAVDTSYCVQVKDLITGVQSDEIQCDPIVIFVDDAGNQSVIWGPNESGKYPIPSGSVSYDTAGTYAYYQPGTSHSYEVEWSGPYVAMDMEYDINQNNTVSGRVELGFPGYTSTGDQPYRFDWAHPKSVEDKADMFSAMHLGLGANWTTALTDMLSLSLGVTYDYYTVSDADATTYLNENYYMTTFNNYLKGGEINGVYWGPGYASEEELIKNNQVAANIDQLRKECPGWQCKAGGEIESFYKALGVRLGLVAKF